MQARCFDVVFCSVGWNIAQRHCCEYTLDDSLEMFIRSDSFKEDLVQVFLP